jgi:chromosome segregation ATPase
MQPSMVERRLIEVGDRLRALRGDLQVADEQLGHFTEEAEDARIRAMVSETPLAAKEHREAARHAEAMARHRQTVHAEITELERQQDELLDRLTGGGS